MEIDSIEET